MKKIFTAIIMLVLGGFIVATPIVASNSALAVGGCVKTAVLGGTKCEEDDKGKLVESASGSINCSCDNGGGSSIVDVLMLVINIMSIIIGILAAIGIAVTGIQYLTAGGNEEKTRKAKRRLFEIVIGVAAYVLLYVFLNWLIPSFSVGS